MNIGMVMEAWTWRDVGNGCYGGWGYRWRGEGRAGGRGLVERRGRWMQMGEMGGERS